MSRLTISQTNLLGLIAVPALFAMVVFSQPSFAQTGSTPAAAQLLPTDQIVAQLQQKGYSIVLSERTWLGRGRVVAEKNGVRREVVFNPGTGEILRDYAMRLTDTDEESGKANGADSRTLAATADPTEPNATPVTHEITLDEPVGLSLGAGQ